MIFAASLISVRTVHRSLCLYSESCCPVTVDDEDHTTTFTTAFPIAANQFLPVMLAIRYPPLPKEYECYHL
jgi:hypothetical protein